uniref:RAD18 E3 ubiquitin protein ligase n=1 Tax=Neogobius melanostomus TaxID=47308 RepID=A0A8C6V114_9GOBI
MSLDIETDFPPSLCVDTLLRCPICFDFLNITVMTKCSHNCNLLSVHQKFLSYKLQCPVCNMVSIAGFEKYRLLDDLVANFQVARQQLSKAMFESPPKTPVTPAVSVRCKTARTPKSSSALLSQYFQKKPSKETKQDVPTTPLMKEEPMEVELSSVKVLLPVKQEKIASFYEGGESAHSSSMTKDVKPVIKVDCPHLDMCLSSGEKKESLRSALGKSRRPMAKLVYNLLSLQELKRRLKDCHLSVQGTRDQLIKRHQEFIHVYNAQCDSLNPKSAEDIAKEVEANEKMRTKLQEKAKPVSTTILFNDSS